MPASCRRRRRRRRRRPSLLAALAALASVLAGAASGSDLSSSPSRLNATLLGPVPAATAPGDAGLCAQPPPSPPPPLGTGLSAVMGGDGKGRGGRPCPGRVREQAPPRDPAGADHVTLHAGARSTVAAVLVAAGLGAVVVVASALRHRCPKAAEAASRPPVSLARLPLPPPPLPSLPWSPTAPLLPRQHHRPASASTPSPPPSEGSDGGSAGGCPPSPLARPIRSPLPVGGVPPPRLRPAPRSASRGLPGPAAQ